MANLEIKTDFCEEKESSWRLACSFSSCLAFILLAFSSLALAGFIQPQNSIRALCLTLVYSIEHYISSYSVVLAQRVLLPSPTPLFLLSSNSMTWAFNVTEFLAGYCPKPLTGRCLWKASDSKAKEMCTHHWPYWLLTELQVNQMSL